MTKKKEDKIYDARTALIAADAFRKHALMFISELPKTNLDEAANFAVRNLGEFIASATTIALALELYLKAIHISIGLSVPKSHNLLGLFEQLPKVLKDSIETQYKQNSTQESGKTAGLELRIKVDEVTIPIDDESNNQIVSYDLKSVLDRSSDAFVTWRYIHEGGKRGEYAYYNYEFFLLELICHTLHSHITSIFKAKNK